MQKPPGTATTPRDHPSGPSGSTPGGVTVGESPERANKRARFTAPNLPANGGTPKDVKPGGAPKDVNVKDGRVRDGDGKGSGNGNEGVKWVKAQIGEMEMAYKVRTHLHSGWTSQVKLHRLSAFGLTSLLQETILAAVFIMQHRVYCKKM